MSNVDLSKEYYQNGVISVVKRQLSDINLSLYSIRQNTQIDQDEWLDVIKDFENFREKYENLTNNRYNKLKQ